MPFCNVNSTVKWTVKSTVKCYGKFEGKFYGKIDGKIDGKTYGKTHGKTHGKRLLIKKRKKVIKLCSWLEDATVDSKCVHDAVACTNCAMIRK